MPTREIPRAEWPRFFKRFTRVHSGWLCSLEVLSPALGAQIEARDLPLAGIDVESGAADAPVRVTLGDRTGARLSHAISGVQRIFLEQTEEGADEVLEIENDGVKTLLRFRVAALPETVDDIA